MSEKQEGPGSQSVSGAGSKAKPRRKGKDREGGYSGCGIMITREADYAVRCILYMSSEPERTRNVREVAEAMLIPVSFLAKILQRLLKQGLVTSTRGAGGGFRLARKPADITLHDVVLAIDGPLGLNRCAIEGQTCELSATCPVHPIWMALSKDLIAKLKKYDFQGLPKRKRGKAGH